MSKYITLSIGQIHHDSPSISVVRAFDKCMEDHQGLKTCHTLDMGNIHFSTVFNSVTSGCLPHCMGAHSWVPRICQPWEMVSIQELATKSGSSWISHSPNLHLVMLKFKDLNHCIQTTCLNLNCQFQDGGGGGAVFLTLFYTSTLKKRPPLGRASQKSHYREYPYPPTSNITVKSGFSKLSD